MFKKLFLLFVASLLLAGCANEAAAPADVDWWLWNWWNQTLQTTMAKKCAGLPAGSSVPVNGAQVPCPGTEASPPGTFQGEVAAYAVTVANGWPIDFGENRMMTVQAPEGQDLVVNYGREGFDVNGQQVQVCGTALIQAGYTYNLTFWTGNAEAVTAGYGAEYANFTYANRSDPTNGDTRCQAWEAIGFTPFVTTSVSTP